MPEALPVTASVILASRKGSRRLNRCLRSLAAAEVDGMEVLVVDDACVPPLTFDRSGLDCPVTVLRNSRRRGGGVSLNCGAAAARGEVLIFLEDHARLSPRSLAAARAALSGGDSRRGEAHAVILRATGALAVNAALLRDHGGFASNPSYPLDELSERLSRRGVPTLAAPGFSPVGSRWSRLEHGTLRLAEGVLRWFRRAAGPVRFRRTAIPFPWSVQELRSCVSDTATPES
jgi:glycosyltransferase involved in cell wall biosynthesis